MVLFFASQAVHEHKTLQCYTTDLQQTNRTTRGLDLKYVLLHFVLFSFCVYNTSDEKVLQKVFFLCVAIRMESVALSTRNQGIKMNNLCFFRFLCQVEKSEYVIRAASNAKSQTTLELRKKCKNAGLTLLSGLFAVYVVPSSDLKTLEIQKWDASVGKPVVNGTWNARNNVVPVHQFSNKSQWNRNKAQEWVACCAPKIIHTARLSVAICAVLISNLFVLISSKRECSDISTSDAMRNHQFASDKRHVTR